MMIKNVHNLKKKLEANIFLKEEANLYCVVQLYQIYIHILKQHEAPIASLKKMY